MTFEGFDAATLIDVQQTSPLLLPTGPDDGPTLQKALAERSAATAGFASLRPLSTDELLLLAGSNVTVTGPSPGDPDPRDWWDPTLPNDPYPDGPYGGGSGGGGENPSGESEGDNPGGPFDDRVRIDPSVPPDQLERARQAELQSRRR